MVKRGQVEIQFNWVFVLIVGAIILAFFVAIVMKGKDLSEKKTGAKLSFGIETITTGASVSKGTAQIITIPNLGLEFSSTEECLREYSIGGATRQYRDRVIFAPQRIEGNELLAWTIDWALPYRITNFLFYTSPYMRYIIFADDTDPQNWALAKKINQSLPEEMYHELFRLSEIDTSVMDNKNYKVRLVFLNSGQRIPHYLVDMKDTDLTALEASTTPGKEDLYTVKFYNKKVDSFINEKETLAIGRASLYGAIFTEDFDMYRCNMQDAFKKMYFITSIVYNRTDYLYHNANNANCEAKYKSVIDTAGVLKDLKTTSLMLSSTLTDTDVNNVYVYAYGPSGLQSINNGLQVASCPRIY